MPDLSKHPLNKAFDLDGAINAVWNFYKEWFVKLFVISFVFSLLTGMASTLFDFSSLMDTTDPEEIMALLGSMIGPYFLVIFLSFVFSVILQYYIIRKPVDEDISFMGIVGTSLTRYFLPLLLISILIGIFAVVAVMLGFFLLIIGAFFAILYVVMIATFVSPILMIENKDIAYTITRTVQLSHKTFWPNIGWVCVFGILLMVISGILGMVVMIPYGGSFFKIMMNPESAMEMMDFTQKPLFVILSALTNAITMPLYPIFTVALYFSRVNKEKEQGIISEDNNITVKDLTP